jgi:hypothetical protein
MGHALKISALYKMDKINGPVEHFFDICAIKIFLQIQLSNF